MKRQRGILTRSQADSLLRACTGSWTGTRNRALIALCYRTGVRPGEALGLQVDDIRCPDPLGGALVVRVEKPKGYQRDSHPTPPREVGIDSRTGELLRAWIGERGAEPGPLFVTRKGGALSGRYFRAMMEKLGRKAGIPGRVHPHGLRHSAAHDLYRETRDLILVSRFLGHTDVKTTMIYLSQIGSCEAVINATSSRSW